MQQYSVVIWYNHDVILMTPEYNSQLIAASQTSDMTNVRKQVLKMACIFQTVSKIIEK